MQLEMPVNIQDNSIQSINSELSNYPNPFNPSTTISYQLPKNSKVELTIYNLKGQKVRTLTNEFKDKGNHTVTWDGYDVLGNPVTSGFYFYKLKTDVFQKVKKMTLIK